MDCSYFGLTFLIPLLILCPLYYRFPFVIASIKCFMISYTPYYIHQTNHLRGRKKVEQFLPPILKMQEVITVIFANKNITEISQN
ncbi:MAG: hypothetical protein ACTSQO_12965 [Candidatus Helarchaeota archaeon]